MMGWWRGFGWGPSFGPGFHSGFGLVMGIAGLVLMLFFWAAIIGLAIWAIRAFLRSPRRAGNGSVGTFTGQTAPANDGALAILKERYARGEITRAEFDEIRHTLSM